MVVSGPEGAAKAAAELAGRLLERLKVWETAEWVAGQATGLGGLRLRWCGMLLYCNWWHCLLMHQPNLAPIVLSACSRLLPERRTAHCWPRSR